MTPKAATVRTRFLAETDLLAGMPFEFLAEVDNDLQEVTAPKGTVVFEEGETGDAVYFLVQGTVRIRKEGVNLLSRSSGECIGEFALIDDRPRSASGVAETEVSLLKWERSDFQRALSQSPRLTNRILRILTRKLRQDVSLQLESTVELERWQDDLKRAHQIQMAMLPEGGFSSENVDIAGYCSPARYVGGDYYDYLPVGDDKLGLVIADVLGHGFYSGLLAAMAKSCLHTQARIDASPDKVLEAMSHTASLSARHGLMMSCCYLVLDFRNRVLSYSNAGHPHPLLYHRAEDGLERLESTAPPLGIPYLERVSHEKREARWEPGDTLLLFSDGVPESRDKLGEFFDYSRLEGLFLERKHQRPEAIQRSILDALSRHCDGVSPEDDITLVVAQAR